MEAGRFRSNGQSSTHKPSVELGWPWGKVSIYFNG